MNLSLTSELPIDMNFFNNLLTKHGGTAMKFNSNKITMRRFIFKLIKTFRKDFMKKTKRGGATDLYTDTDISPYTRYSDLTFASYKFEPYISLERDVL